MREVVRIAKAVGDENRLRALLFLRQGELCVCQIIAMLGLAPSTVSKHMAVLHEAGLVESRKEGRWIYYRLAEVGAPMAVRQALRWLGKSLADDALAGEDARRVRKIMMTPVERLCACYRMERQTARSEN